MKTNMDMNHTHGEDMDGVSDPFSRDTTGLPDPGLFWYHPHMREDYTQELGLYAPIIVVPTDATYWSPVNREVTLTLDDILLEGGKIAPFSRTLSDHTAMGRFGNVMLVTGETSPQLSAKLGEVVRLYLVNTAN